MEIIYFYNEVGELKELRQRYIPRYVNLVQTTTIKTVIPRDTPLMEQYVMNLEVKQYRKEGKIFFIAGVDERDRLSVLNNLYLDVHVSKEFYDRELYERKVDIEAMMRVDLFRYLSEKLKDRVIFTTKPSYTPNHRTIIASI